MSGSFPTQSLPVFATQKTSNFMLKEKKKFKDFSQTFNVEIKEPEVKFERHKAVRLLPKSHFQQLSPNVTSKTLMRKTSASNIYTRNFEREIWTPKDDVKEESQGFQNQVNGIMKKCTQLNKAVYRFEKRLSKAELGFFDTMTGLLSKTEGQTALLQYLRDQQFSKKNILEEVTQKVKLEEEFNNLAKEQNLKMPCTQILSEILNSGPPTPINRSPLLLLNESSEKRQNRKLNPKFALSVCTDSGVAETKSARLSHPMTPTENLHKIMTCRYENSNTNNMSPQPKLVELKTKSAAVQMRHEKKLLTSFSDESIWKNLESIPRYSGNSSAKAYDKILPRNTLQIQTYAVQDDDFLKFPGPKVSSKSSKRIKLLKKPKQPNIKTQDTASPTAIKPEELKLPLHKIKPRETWPNVTYTNYDVKSPENYNFETQTSQMFLKKSPTRELSYNFGTPTSPDNSTLSRYLRSIPTEEARSTRRDTVPELIESIALANENISLRKKTLNKPPVNSKLQSHFRLYPGRGSSD